MDYLPIDAAMKDRIRYYRQKAGLTQKALAEKCGLSEAAIRNYELGNRIPDWDTLSDIADQLNVSYYSIADPDLTALHGAAHALFRLEGIYGLYPEVVDGEIRLVIGESADAPLMGKLLQKSLKAWAEARTAYADGIISQEEYEDWKSRYPLEDESAEPGISVPPKQENEDGKQRFRRMKK